MIKPASGSCNLRCTYCFYHSLANMRESYFKGMMSEAQVDDIIAKALAFTGKDRFYLSFQGGEPLVRGKDFFRHVGEKLKGKDNTHLVIQTNGTLIDDEWCDIFKRYGYLVGISLDGTREGNVCRVRADGTPAFDDIMRGVQLLKAHNIPFNVLTVLSRSVVNNITEIYKFYRECGFKFLQFIPCLKPLDGQPYDKDSYPTEKEYTVFLKKLFSFYLADIKAGKYTSIRQFDNFVRLSRGEVAEQCGMNGYCSHQFVIEADGTVYPCDFYCLDEYAMGNIADSDFDALSHHPIAEKFIRESLVVDGKCKKCNFYALCRGGCKRERIDIEKCNAYKEFFAYALPEMRRIF